MKELSLLELNEVIYALGHMRNEGLAIKEELNDSLYKMFSSDLDKKCAEHDRFLDEYRAKRKEILAEGGSLQD